MKRPLTTLFSTLAIALFSISAFADSEPKPLECKRRHPIVYNSFLWVTLEPAANDTFLFRYGNGIDTQMLEIFFETTVSEVSPGKYAAAKNDSFVLEVNLKNGRLDFEIRGGQDRIVKKKFACGTPSRT